jgi:2-keto-3-deoxy-L-rhamnonate aldolase RhmA
MPISTADDADRASRALRGHGALKQRIRDGRPVLGMFVRTPAPSVVEVLGATELDFVVLDAEHGPFGMDALDRCVLAGRAADVPVLVRLPECSPPRILAALDIGAAGIIIPHIHSAGEARAAAAATRYDGGTRGFSASHRAAGYGKLPPEQFRKLSDAAMILIGQVEDRPGLENIDAITAVAELDAVFIGPADLAASLGAGSTGDPAVPDAIDRICAGCRRAGRSIGIYLHSMDGISQFRDMGISLFIVGTDQVMLRASAEAVAAQFRSACGDRTP